MYIIATAISLEHNGLYPRRHLRRRPPHTNLQGDIADFNWVAHYSVIE